MPKIRFKEGDLIYSNEFKTVFKFVKYVSKKYIEVEPFFKQEPNTITKIFNGSYLLASPEQIAQLVSDRIAGEKSAFFTTPTGWQYSVSGKVVKTTSDGNRVEILINNDYHVKIRIP